jgi:hypothetical protein
MKPHYRYDAKFGLWLLLHRTHPHTRGFPWVISVRTGV